MGEKYVVKCPGCLFTSPVVTPVLEYNMRLLHLRLAGININTVNNHIISTLTLTSFVQSYHWGIKS